MKCITKDVMMALSRTLFCTEDSGRTRLQKLHFSKASQSDHLILTSTDGYRLCRCGIPVVDAIAEKVDCIAAADRLDSIRAGLSGYENRDCMLDIEFDTDALHVSRPEDRNGECTPTSFRVPYAENFPKYKKILSAASEGASYFVTRKSMLDPFFSAIEAHPGKCENIEIDFQSRPKKVVLILGDIDFRYTLELEKKGGNSVRTVVNTSQFLDGLSVVPGENILVKMRSPSDPIFFCRPEPTKEEDKLSYCYLFMPMK